MTNSGETNMSITERIQQHEQTETRTVPAKGDRVAVVVPIGRRRRYGVVVGETLAGLRVSLDDGLHVTLEPSLVELAPCEACGHDGPTVVYHGLNTCADPFDCLARQHVQGDTPPGVIGNV